MLFFEFSADCSVFNEKFFGDYHYQTISKAWHCSIENFTATKKGNLKVKQLLFGTRLENTIKIKYIYHFSRQKERIFQKKIFFLEQVIFKI